MAKTFTFFSKILVFLFFLSQGFHVFSQVTLEVDVKDALCFDSATGSLKAIGKGGTPPYLYSLNNYSYQKEDFFDRLPVGEYRIRVVDKQGQMLRNL